MIRLSGFFPEIVAEWQNAAVTSSDREKMAGLAEGIRSGRYFDLQRSLQTAALIDRTLLFSAALIPHPVTLRNLAELGRTTPQACLERLRTWAPALLRRQEKAGLVFFHFEHEKKRETALRSLPETFADAGQSLRKSVYDFLLSHFSWANTVDDPFCDLYLNDAIKLISSADGWSEYEAEITGLRTLRTLVRGADRGDNGEDKATLNDSEVFITAWPRNLQAMFYLGYVMRLAKHMMLSLDARRRTELPEVHVFFDRYYAESAERFKQWVKDPSATCSSSACAATEAAALHRILGIFLGPRQGYRDLINKDNLLLASLIKDFESDGKVDIVLGRLRSIAQTFSEDEEVIVNVAKAIVPTARLYAETRESEKLENCLRRLRLLHQSFPRSQPPASALAAALEAAVLMHRQGKAIDKMFDLVSELGFLQRKQPSNEKLAAAYAGALARLSTLLDNRLESQWAASLHLTLNKLCAAFPQNQHMAEWVVRAQCEACESFAKQKHWNQVDESIQVIGDVLRAFPQTQQIAQLAAETSYNVVSPLCTAQQLHRVEQRLDFLRSLQLRFAEHSGITLLYAQALVNSISCTKPEETAQRLHTLQTLRSSYPKNAQLAEQLARGVVNALPTFRGDSNAIDLASEAVRLLSRDFPKDPKVAEWCAEALARSFVVYSQPSHGDGVNMNLDALREMQQAFPQSPDIADRYLRGFVNASRMYSLWDHKQGLTAALKEVESFLPCAFG